MKLYIATPSNRAWSPQYGMAILALISQLRAVGMSHAYECRTGVSLLPQGRHEQLAFAVESGFTHALLIDDDMYFTIPAVQSMGQHADNGLDFIAANYVTRPGARAQAPVARDLAGNVLYSKGKTGTEEVSSIGLGFALINLRCLKGIKPPWFEVTWQGPGPADYMGEDHYFCSLLRSHGIKLYVDHEASRYVGHVGEKVYTEDDICNHPASNKT